MNHSHQLQYSGHIAVVKRALNGWLILMDAADVETAMVRFIVYLLYLFIIFTIILEID